MEVRLREAEVNHHPWPRHQGMHLAAVEGLAQQGIVAEGPFPTHGTGDTGQWGGADDRAVGQEARMLCQPPAVRNLQLPHLACLRINLTSRTKPTNPEVRGEPVWSKPVFVRHWGRHASVVRLGCPRDWNYPGRWARWRGQAYSQYLCLGDKASINGELSFPGPQRDRYTYNTAVVPLRTVPLGNLFCRQALDKEEQVLCYPACDQRCCFTKARPLNAPAYSFVPDRVC